MLVNTVAKPSEPVNYLKVVAPVILIKKASNGIRLVAKKMKAYLFETNIMLGCRECEVFTPRIHLIPIDVTILFKLFQFLEKLTFGIFINKYPGQIFSVAGTQRKEPYFSSG